MRRVLYDREGAPEHYLTGAGVVYSMGNRFVGSVQAGEPEPVLNAEGRVVAWMAGGFIWDASGVLAFVKGATPQGELKLPKTAPLRVPLSPTPAPLHPLLQRIEPPPLHWVWSDETLADVLVIQNHV